jgi:hypothetical protein
VFNGHWWFLARHSWKVVAVVHLVQVNHLLPTAHARLVTYARHVAISTSAFICVVEERCAIAFVAVAKAEELRTTDILAEVHANLWSHWHTILFHCRILVPTLMSGLGIEDATDPPMTCGASLWVNVVNALKRELLEVHIVCTD